jgi:hypothetical protein
MTQCNFHKMLGVFVKDSAFEHKICGVPSTFAQAMRRAISEKNDNLFLVIQGNLVARIRQVCPAAVVSVSLGGPFKDVFDSPNAKGVFLIFSPQKPLITLFWWQILTLLFVFFRMKRTLTRNSWLQSRKMEKRRKKLKTFGKSLTNTFLCNKLFNIVQTSRQS